MTRSRPAAVRVLLLLAALALLALALPPLAAMLAGAAIRAAARAHRSTVTWTHLEWRPPLAFRLSGLLLEDARGTALATAETLSVALDAGSVLLLHPRPASLELAHARLRLRSGAGADADTLAPEEEPPASPNSRAGSRDRSALVRNAARALVRALLLPARRLPRLELRDVECVGREEQALRLHLDWLTLGGARGVARLAASGVITGAQRIPFTLELTYDRDDRLAGGARMLLDPPGGGPAEALSLSVIGAREPGPPSRPRGARGLDAIVRIGRVPLDVSGRTGA